MRDHGTGVTQVGPGSSATRFPLLVGLPSTWLVWSYRDRLIHKIAEARPK